MSGQKLLCACACGPSRKEGFSDQLIDLDRACWRLLSIPARMDSIIVGFRGYLFKSQRLSFTASATGTSKPGLSSSDPEVRTWHMSGHGRLTQAHPSVRGTPVGHLGSQAPQVAGSVFGEAWPHLPKVLGGEVPVPVESWVPTWSSRACTGYRSHISPGPAFWRLERPTPEATASVGSETL